MSDSFNKIAKKNSAKSLIVSMFFLALIVAAAIAFFKYYEREKPLISFDGDIVSFGLSKKVTFSAADSRSGISMVEMFLVQGNKKVKIYGKNFQRRGFFEHNGPKKLDETVTLEAASLGFSDGKAELQVTVRDFSFWGWMSGNKTFIVYPVILDTLPPKIRILHSTRYVNRGGSGMVVYKIDSAVEKHGLTINGHFNPGFPISDKDDNSFIAFFGLSFDTDNIDQAVVSATDTAGNTGSAGFSIILKRKAFKEDRINITDNFLNLKLPEFAQDTLRLAGSQVDQFVHVNSQIRKENYQTIVQLTANPSPLRLWSGAFLRMPRSSRMAGFAEHRTYYHNGNEIDKQVHLGIDLASTKMADVHAANGGRVIFADYLGIYGNTIILDHGQGIFSLYSHLSEIRAAVGELQDKGALIGLTGNSGMAGGDHLHFSMLVNGIFVSPLEWWDRQWLQLNIDDILFGSNLTPGNLL